jgi:hypothetical protein
LVALDSNAMTGLIEALAAVAVPNNQEMLALAKTFFYLPLGDHFHLAPTVEREYRNIHDVFHFTEHRNWAKSSFRSINILPQAERVVKLREIHRDENDCRILAECEAALVTHLLTLDEKFLKNLQRHTQGVLLCTPVEYWNSLAIKQGALPQRLPHPTNPLARETWWRA